MELGHQMTSEEISQMMAAMDKTGSNTVTRDGALPFSPNITPPSPPPPPPPPPPP
jgi:hypothetical protein